MKLTHQQMLAHWREAMGWEQPLANTSVEVFEGASVAPMMARDMRRWYLDLLDFGPARCLATTNEPSKATVVAEGNGIWRLDLTPDVRRVVSVGVAGGPLNPVLGDPSKDEWPVRHLNPYLIPRAPQAIAIMQSALAGRTRPSVLLLCLTPDGQPPVISNLDVVVDIDDEHYSFDESALGLLPEAVRKYSSLPNILKP